MRPSRHKGWLQLCLLAVLFSALHGTLGAVVVKALASPQQVVAEICTPQGLQWLALDGREVVAVNPDSETRPDWPQGLAKPCAWSAAFLALFEPSAPPLGSPAARAQVGLFLCLAQELTTASRTPWRVLLMSAMRAPPDSRPRHPPST